MKYNARAKNCFFYSLFLCGISSFLAIPILSTSCSTNKMNNDIDDTNKKPDEIPDFPDEDLDNDNDNITDEDLKVESFWYEGFINETKLLSKKLDYVSFELSEEMFDSIDYRIQYIGERNDIPSFSVFVKKINKFYSISLKANYEKLFNNFSKLKMKNFVSNNVISDFENNMILEHEINDNNFFITMDSSDESLSFQKNEIINFQSSWGVENKQTKKVTFNLDVSSIKIKNMLFGSQKENSENYEIKDVYIKDVYILPRVVLIDSPLNWFKFNIDFFKDNIENKNINLTDQEKSYLSLDFPKNENSINKFWSGKIQDRNYEGEIVDLGYEDGISSSIYKILNKPQNNNFSNIIERIDNLHKKSVENHINTITNKGKRIAINKKIEYKDNLEKLASWTISSSISAAANSMNIFGDGTKCAIFQVNSIQKMNVSFIEYKKI